MNKKTLLVCSALLAAPFSSLLAGESLPAQDGSNELAENELRQEALAYLNEALSLPKAVEKVMEGSDEKLISSISIAHDSAFDLRPKTLIARLKDKVEPGISELKGEKPESAAVLTSSPDGRAPQASAIKITNS